MAFDGSGVFTVLYNWATEAASPPIAISKLDTEMAGIATGLSSCMLRTGGTVTGATTFSANVTLSGTLVRQLFNETDAATDEKIWEWRASGGAFSLIADNDSSTGVTTPMAVTRTGTTIDSITFAGTTIAITGNETVSGTLGVTGVTSLTGNLAINTNKFNVTAASGNTTIAGTLAVTGAITSSADIDADTLEGNAAAAFVLASTVTSGSFTAALRATNGGADLDTGTAYWHKHGRAVTVYLPELLTSGTATTFVIDDIPAAIQFAVNGSAATYQVMMGKDNGGILPVTVACLYGTDYWTLKVADGYAAFNAAAAEKGILSGSISYMMDDA
ncbi:MAG: hypothetical protein IPH53_21040 [Flavobacteriales bacterium]|nr:hypothetical protein [Flavobacteriales bacterium]